MLDPISTLSDVYYELECEAFPGLRFGVSEMRIVEALNEPYKIEALVRLPASWLEPFDFAALLGQSCTVHVGRHTRERVFRGMIRELHEGEHDEHVSWARLVAVPALWMLSLGRNSRIFQELSAIEILEQVLGDPLARFGRAAVFHTTRAYPRREYCVQYQESDLDFAHRLMEEEGIGYSFDHTPEHELLVVHDSNRPFLPVETSHVPGFVPYEPHNLEVGTSEPVVDFRLRRRETVRRVAIRDFDWTQPAVWPEGAAAHDELAARPSESYEHGHGRSLCVWSYAESSAKYAAHDGPAQAALRLEGVRVQALVGVGRGRVTTFSPGKRFLLAGHPTIGVDGEYVLLRVEHGTRRETSDAAADPYANRFECIPSSQEYRPARRVPKPRIASMQTAIVVGPPGEEIHTDVHGRIKVRFHWDRQSQFDDSASCWVRVQQAWAGAGWGFLFLPRIGMEVVVTFIDGDPDRPLVTGAVYDGANPPPYALPDEKTKSTIKTRTSPGGAGYNELRFEDRASAEEIWLHGQKDWNTVIEHDVTERVGHDRARVVIHDETVSIGHDHVQSVGADRTRSVAHDESVTVANRRSVRVGADHVRDVGGADHLTVQGERGVHVEGSERRRVGGDLLSAVGGHRVERVGGECSQRAVRTVLEAEEEILLVVGGAYVRILPDKIYVDAHRVFLNSHESAPSAEPPVSAEE